MSVYCSCTCETLQVTSRKDPMKQSLSILLFCHLSGCFLGIGLLDFTESWHGAGNPYEVAHDSPIFWKNLSCLKIGEMGQKCGYLNLKKNLVINLHWICSIKKLLFAVSLHKSYIWEKSCSWDIGQNILSLSDCRIFKSRISPE